jgi:hypothetical protein
MTERQIREAYQRLGVACRAADVEVVVTLGSTPEVMAEYVWDHLMGEPETPTEIDVLASILQSLYDVLSANRQAAIRRYDRIPDGDVHRIEATGELDRLNALVREVEAEFEKIDLEQTT